jgi:fluoride exporter
MNSLLAYASIGLGSAIGGVARYLCSLASLAWAGPAFPWGTICVNLLGSLVIGFFATLTGPDARLLVRPLARQFVMLGICGGYTTFSAFSLETLTLLERGARGAATANVGLSLALSLVAVWAGHAAAARANG